MLDRTKNVTGENYIFEENIVQTFGRMISMRERGNKKKKPLIKGCDCHVSLVINHIYASF